MNCSIGRDQQIVMRRIGTRGPGNIHFFTAGCFFELLVFLLQRKKEGKIEREKERERERGRLFSEPFLLWQLFSRFVGINEPEKSQSWESRRRIPLFSSSFGQTWNFFFPRVSLFFANINPNFETPRGFKLLPPSPAHPWTHFLPLCRPSLSTHSNSHASHWSDSVCPFERIICLVSG